MDLDAEACPGAQASAGILGDIRAIQGENHAEEAVSRPAEGPARAGPCDAAPSKALWQDPVPHGHDLDKMG